MRPGRHQAVTGTPTPASTGGWGGLHGRPLRRTRGREVELSLAMITDWGTLGLGTWVDDVQITATARRPSPRRTSSSDDGGWGGGRTRRRARTRCSATGRGAARSSREGGVVTTDDTVYTGFGFEGMNAAARPEFMKRVLKHLGVVKDTPGGGNPVPAKPGGNSPRARERQDQGRQEAPRRPQAPRQGARRRAPATPGRSCKGKAQLLRKGKAGAASSSRSRPVRRRRSRSSSKKSAFKALKRKGKQRLTIKVTGTDSAAAAFTARKTVGSSRRRKKASSRCADGRPGLRSKVGSPTVHFHEHPGRRRPRARLRRQPAALHLHGGARPAAGVDPRLRGQELEPHAEEWEQTSSPTPSSRAWASWAARPLLPRGVRRPGRRLLLQPRPGRGDDVHSDSGGLPWASRSTRTWRPADPPVRHGGAEAALPRPAIAGEKISCLGITEPDAGSDVSGIRTRAVRDGDEWVINGSKTYITNGHRADFIVLVPRPTPRPATTASASSWSTWTCRA